MRRSRFFPPLGIRLGASPVVWLRLCRNSRLISALLLRRAASHVCVAAGIGVAPFRLQKKTLEMMSSSADYERQQKEGMQCPDWGSAAVGQPLSGFQVKT